MDDDTNANHAMKYYPRNRHKAMTAKKKRKFWCNCDMCLVGEWGKCPVCGRYQNKKKKRNGMGKS